MHWCVRVFALDCAQGAQWVLVCWAVRSPVRCCAQYVHGQCVCACFVLKKHTQPMGCYGLPAHGPCAVHGLRAWAVRRYYAALCCAYVSTCGAHAGHVLCMCFAHAEHLRVMCTCCAVHRMCSAVHRMCGAVHVLPYVFCTRANFF